MVGLTQTHALLDGSIALDVGGFAYGSACNPEFDFGGESTDQRGEPRVSGASCDLGAYEYQDTNSFFVIPTKDGKVVIFSL